jgi:hypothetical protein
VKRVAYGWAQYVVDYLEADDAYRARHRISKASQLRIRSLLDQTIRVDQLLEMIMSSRTGWGPAGFAPVREAIDALNRHFAEYPSVVGIEYDSDFRQQPYFSEHVSSVFHGVTEGVVARYIFHLAEDRLISNFRECLCGKLFFAKRSDQKSCKALCRHKLYEQTEEFKAKRREKMRERYRLHKEGRVKEKNV